MTERKKDKQIIIDGVRVDECCWFDYENDGYEDSCYMFQNECSAQNCYYKQLKRKEQECERLRFPMSDTNYAILTKEEFEQLNQLKAENEKLKNELKNNKLEYQLELNTYNIECGNLLEENKELAHYLACMTEQRNRANTTLREIKKLVNKTL